MHVALTYRRIKNRFKSFLFYYSLKNTLSRGEFEWQNPPVQPHDPFTHPSILNGGKRAGSMQQKITIQESPF